MQPRIEEITYPSSIDPLPRLEAAVAYPLGAENLPLVLLMHPDMPGTRAELLPDIERLARQGLFAAAVSLRGRDGSDGQPDVNGREAFDIYDAVLHLRRRYAPIVSPDRAHGIGYSSGGANVLACALRFPDFLVSVHAFFPPTDWRAFLETMDRERFAATLGKEGIEERLAAIRSFIGGSPEEAPERYRARNLLRAVGNNRQIPIQLFHDAEDRFTLPFLSESYLARAWELSMANVSLFLSRRGDRERYLHARPSAWKGLVEAERHFIPQILQRVWPAPVLPPEGALTVLGYLKTKRFEIWLGEGTKSTAEVAYRLKKDTAEFSFRPAEGGEALSHYPRIGVNFIDDSARNVE
ncbi:MAG: alpha/beta hydrolase [Armatimonadetes bacterium]|nr:alpha/beta hydrolase [Armatimonadota bacterium]